MKKQNHFFDFDEVTAEVNYRFLQPPQIAYFVSTVDSYGNENVTPVTLGTLVAAQGPRGEKPSEYFFTFALGCQNFRDEGNEIRVRQGLLNLIERGECVISYIGADLERESFIAGLPIPYGIDEKAVSGLTPLPSTKVAPSGIDECPINMEARVVSQQKLGSYYSQFTCQIVGISLTEEIMEKDDGLGVFHLDPLFEVYIGNFGESRSHRLYFGKLDRTFLHRSGDGLGCAIDWVGTFEKWISSEYERGTITFEVKERALKLNSLWQECKDPQKNRDVKEELTAILRKICQLS